jgi:hypothetical protein
MRSGQNGNGAELRSQSVSQGSKGVIIWDHVFVRVAAQIPGGLQLAVDMVIASAVRRKARHAMQVHASNLLSERS